MSEPELEEMTTPEWDQLGIPVDDEAEPDNAGPEHDQEVSGR